MIFPVFSTQNHKTITAKASNSEDLVTSKGIIIKDELIYKSDMQGDVSLFKQEGEKIGRGIQVARINNTEGSTYSKELEEIDEQIEILKKTSNNKDTFYADKEKIYGNIDAIINELQNSILVGDYNDALILKDTLLISIDKQQLVTGKKNLVSYSLESLQERKDEIIKIMERSNSISYSPKAGIISYELDGLEEIFTASRINDFEPKDYRIIDVNKIDLKLSKEVKYGDPVYKVVDNFTWYIMTEIEANTMDKLEEGKTIYIKINNEDKRIISRIEKLVKEKDKYFIILKLTAYFHDYYMDRYLDIHIVRNTYEGLIIPNESIIEKDGLKGVYIKDISGIVKFRPVKILTSNDEHTIVSEGVGSNSLIEFNIKGETQNLSTIKMFDEVFIYGNKVKEGLIID